jgi:hypothetical protein
LVVIERNFYGIYKQCAITSPSTRGRQSSTRESKEQREREIRQRKNRERKRERRDLEFAGLWPLVRGVGGAGDQKMRVRSPREAEFMQRQHPPRAAGGFLRLRVDKTSQSQKGHALK